MLIILLILLTLSACAQSQLDTLGSSEEQDDPRTVELKQLSCFPHNDNITQMGQECISKFRKSLEDNLLVWGICKSIQEGYDCMNTILRKCSSQLKVNNIRYFYKQEMEDVGCQVTDAGNLLSTNSLVLTTLVIYSLYRTFY